jgi:hypothetical protein
VTLPARKSRTGVKNLVCSRSSGTIISHIIHDGRGPYGNSESGVDIPEKGAQRCEHY